MSHHGITAGYDLLVIDLDGTLLASDGTVSAVNRRAVGRARTAGFEVVIATGRALVESIEPLSAIEHGGVVVTAGGSMMCDAATGTTLERIAMAPDLVRDVTHSLLRHEHKVLLLKDADAAGYDYLAVGPAALDPASAWWFETLPVRVRFAHELDDDPHADHTVRVGAVASAGELATIAAQLRDEIGDRGFLQHWAAVTASGATGHETHLLEVFTPDVSKWTMIRRYCATRGIDPGRVAAIGDGLNDVELVRESGLGIAMGNADPRVRAVADRETASADDDGVARAIEKLVEAVW